MSQTLRPTRRKRSSFKTPNRQGTAVISSSRLNLINQLSLVPLSLLPLDTAD